MQIDFVNGQSFHQRFAFVHLSLAADEEPFSFQACGVPYLPFPLALPDQAETATRQLVGHAPFPRTCEAGSSPGSVKTCLHVLAFDAPHCSLLTLTVVGEFTILYPSK